MRIRQVMSKGVVLVDPATTIAAAARMMRRGDVGCLIIGEDQRVLGIVTDRDIVVRALARGMQITREPVRSVMSKEVICCFEDQPVEEAAALMSKHEIRRLPVLDRRGCLVGIVSLSDLRGGASKKKPYEVIFYKELADSCGTVHEVPIRTVHIAGVGCEQEAIAAAARVLKRDRGAHRWKDAPDGCRIESRL